eukprot:GCRY01003391.1.p1 GENE.GCRY01003391.1~~GCRY01003391.1.p1  ORF type:complete len:1660 (+),score=148.71 GCRY01003391.1:130-5109(+)
MDICVEHVKRSTVKQDSRNFASIERIIEQDVSIFMKRKIKAFEQNWNVVEFDGVGIKGKLQAVGLAESKDLPIIRYQVDVQQSSNDACSLDKMFSKEHSSELNELSKDSFFEHGNFNKSLWNEDAPRFPIFRVFYDPCHSSASLSQFFREKPKKFSAEFGFRFIVHIKDLKLPLELVEPFFVSIFLFDVKSKTCCSECFSLPIIPPDFQDSFTKKAVEPLFSVQNPSKNLHLIVKIEKTLSSDKEFELYFKPENVKGKHLDMIKANASRLKDFRQCFAWGVLPLFEDSGELILANDEKVNPLFRLNPDLTEEKMGDLIPEILGGNYSKRLKVISGYVSLSVETFSESSFENALIWTPAQLPTSPNEVHRCSLLEIQSFLPHLEPFLMYQNFLYVYPEFVNLANRGGSLSVRNIVCSVMLKETDSIDQPPLKVLYGNSQNSLKESLSSAVTYHSKSPSFLDEFKIELPINLTGEHHLLFVFYHVTCKVTNKNECATPIGYSWVPVFRHGRVISNGVHETPVAIELFNGYRENKEIKFIDNKKPLFRFKTRCVSSVFSEDEDTACYFNALERDLSESSLSSSIKGLENANTLDIIHHMPFIFESLLDIISHNSICRAQAFSTFLQLCKRIASERNESGRCSLLESFVHCFNVPVDGKTSEILIEELLCLIENVNDSVSDGGFSQIWIIFDLIIKCLVCENHDECSFDYSNQLAKLFELSSTFISSKKDKGLNLVKALNRNLSFFLGDLVETMEEQETFNLIRHYFFLLRKGDDTVTNELVLDCCSILCQTPHILSLSRSISCNFESTDFGKYLSLNSGSLYFSFLILEQIVMAFKHSEKSVRQRGVLLLREFFFTKETQSKETDQKAVSMMFFPFIFVILDNLAEIQTWSLFERRNIFVCFFWIFKNIDSLLLQNWLRAETHHRLVKLFSALAVGFEAFKYLGKNEISKLSASSNKDVTVNNKELLEKMYGGGGGSLTRTRRTLTMRGHSTLGEEHLRFKRKTLKSQTEIYQANYDWKVEGALCLEVGLVILNFLAVYESSFEHQLLENHNGCFEDMFNLLIAIGKHNQSENFIVSLARFFRILVLKYSEIIFSIGTAYLVKLCPLLMGFCNHKSETTRSSSAGLLYVLMQMNFKLFGNFTRMKVQTTVALSQLVGEVIENDVFIKESLNCLLQYCSVFEKDEGISSSHSFRKQLNDLIDGLFGILKDSSSIKRCSSDPEMTADLFFNVAQGYKQAPDIRVAWLRNLANFHSERGNWAEAGECVLHIAASVAEYLERHEPTPGMPKGASAFRHISENIVDESAIAELLVDDEETCQSEPFSQAGLVNLLREGISLFKKGQLFESIHEVYKLLIPIFEAERRYEELCEVFSDLHLIFKEIVSCTKTDSRILGTYYRVAFYGKPFLELSGKQFIYKEPFCTQLVDIVPRLQSLYEGILSQTISIIQGSKPVSDDLIYSDIPSIQITSVLPFFDEWEMKEKHSYFERNNNVKQFVFETPFTQEGKVHGTLSEQWIKQTILQVASDFPYVKKRIEVSNILERQISPIENGIKNVEEQTLKLKAELKKEPVDLKQLQMNLQGSVRVQVNAGPLEICRVFLDSTVDTSKFHTKHVKRLKNAVRQFLKTCREALEVNGNSIGPEQTEFHTTLQQGYAELDEEINRLIE